MSAALPEDLAQAIRAQRSATVDELGSEPTLWLAAAPLWTRNAAEASGFPAGSVAEFVDHARDVGWCESRGSRRNQGSGDLQFWIPDEARRDVIDVLSQREGTDRLRREVKGIAKRVTSTGTTLPAALQDWAELMGQPAPEKALIDRVRRAVEADDLGHAQQLVVVGETLAPLLAGAAELAVDRARRLMNLGARRRQDGRALGRYLDRPSLSDAVARLLDASPEAAQWALHLRGVGGVGKTMLVRYLTSGRYASERGSGIIPIARADFDHISADYPVRRPVQLLLELADELALHTAAITGADRALSAFRATATSAHEALSSLREESVPPLEHPLVLRAIDGFAQAINRLPGVVLLILDTCEELAKADAGNPAAPAVQATFGIIERLHDRAKLTRVLLAGRRPLPTRQYLTEEHVTGFTVDEARDYLGTFSARPLGRDLQEALIRLSPAVDTDLPSAGNLPERVSPFDLALYLRWAEEDPSLDTRRIEVAGRDAYIEGRIIDRLSDPVVLKALPVLALLGRCRVSTLASVVDEGTLPAGVLAARIAEQEWIDADGDPPTRLTVKPGLVRSLRRYFSATARQAGFTATAARLAKVLRRAVSTQPLADIDVDELLAALRWSDPAEAAGLWDDIAERAEAPPGRWGWVLNVARRVLGESEEEQWPSAEALRATVTASYIAASRRADMSFNPAGLWAEVREKAGCHPDEAAGRILRMRAALGLLPYAADDPSVWADLATANSSPALAAAAVDAADRLLEAGAPGAVARLVRLGLLRAALDGKAGDRVRAWGRVVQGRLLDAENRREARYILAAAEAAAEDAAEDEDAEPAWADWVPPADLLARVRIEFGLLCAVGGLPAAVRPYEWESYARAHLGRIDRERLASLCLRLRLAKGTIEQAELERWEQLDGYEPGRLPACSAHDLVPPLFVTLAEAELDAGRPERALALIGQRRAEALSHRGDRADDSTLRLADAETVRLARRLRLDDQRATLARLASAGYSDPSLLGLQDAARRAMAVVHHEPPKHVGPEVWTRAEGWHAWWQSQPVPPADLPPAQWTGQPGAPGIEAADIELDLEELRQLGYPSLEKLQRNLAGWLAGPRPETPPVRSADPFADVRVALRREALTGRPYSADPGIPRRRLAELAFEEAELLAPRLPLAAARLFARAALAYAQASDAVGQMLAAASLAAITDGREERASLRDAWDRLCDERPDVAAALTDPAPASPWHYWGALVQRLLSLPTPSPPGSSLPAYRRSDKSAPDSAGRGVDRSRVATVFRVSWLVVVLAAWVTGVVTVSATVPMALSSANSPAPADQASSGLLTGAVLVVLAVTPYLITSLMRSRRLADGRGLGTLRPENLRLTATISTDPGEAGRVQLVTEPRALQEAPGFRAALALPLLHLVRTWRSRPPTGYLGEFDPDPTKPVSLKWTKPPTAGNRWWRRGTGVTSGAIQLESTQVTRPWEHILSASTGPGAAGRIQWVRLLVTSAAPFEATEATEVAIDAPPAWRAGLEKRYRAAAGSAGPDFGHIRVRHAMGRAVASSAGYLLDVSGEATTIAGAEKLLDAAQLVWGKPALVVLQAEPTDEVIDASLRDDSPERLALAADLIEAGAPAVLVLPALRTDLAQAAIDAIAAHAAAAQRDGAEALQATLRKTVKDYVEPSVLNDIVLFLNVRRDQ